MSSLASNYVVPLTALLATVAVGFTLFKSRGKPIWIEENASLGTPRASKSRISGTAVVCGGSIAGILTARICADHFEKVILVDPEFTQTLNGKRKTRVMQYNSFHLYLAPLMDGLRQLWPDFDSEVTKAGGLYEIFLIFHIFRRMMSPDLPRFLRPLPTTLHMRRANFEKSLQKLLVEHPTFSNIRVVDGTVRRIIRSEDGKSIISVGVRDLDGQSVTLDDVALVADCTGSTQGGIKWLEAAGYKLPETLRVSYNPKLFYMTASFTVTPNLAHALASAPGADVRQRNQTHVPYVYHPHSSRGAGAMFAIAQMDSDIIQLLFGGWDVPNLPTSLDAIEPYLLTLNATAHEPIPSWVSKMVEDIIEHGGSPVFEPAKTAPLNYVRYSEVDDLPSNFVAIGDSTMMVNPLYGQGCFKAMLGVLALNGILASHNHEPIPPRDLSRQYFKRLASRTQGLWDSTRFTDYGYATTEPIQGETLATGRFSRWLSAKLMSASSKDGEVASILWRVIALYTLESELYSPRVMWKILWTSSRFGS